LRVAYKLPSLLFPPIEKLMQPSYLRRDILHAVIMVFAGSVEISVADLTHELTAGQFAYVPNAVLKSDEWSKRWLTSPTDDLVAVTLFYLI